MALSTSQQADILFKKLQGQGDSSTTKQFFEETKPGRSAVFSTQIWGQSGSIPTTAPGGTDGQTTGVVTRYIANSLTAIAGISNSFYSANLIDCIPFNFGDGSYNYVLTDSVGTSIPFGQGDWLVDPDAGILTFFGTVPANMPPKLSWYKYAGTKGAGGFTGGNVSGNTQFQSTVEFLQSVDSTTTGSSATLALPTPYVKVTNASLVSITKVTPGVPNQIAIVTNGLGTAVTLINNVGTPSSARILTGTGVNLSLAAGASVWLAYDLDTGSWRVIGGSGGGGGSARAVASFTGTVVAPNTTGDDTFVYTGSSAQTFTGFGTISGLTNGKRVALMGTDDVNILSLAESDTTNGWLTNGPLDLSKAARIEFEYNSTLARMVEVSRSPR